jgi:hypothetical protein
MVGEELVVLSATLARSTRRLLPGQRHVAMETAPTLFADEVLRYVGEQRASSATVPDR